MEVFANLFALHTDGSELAKAVANRFAPRAYKEMLKALGEQE